MAVCRVRAPPLRVLGSVGMVGTVGPYASGLIGTALVVVAIDARTRGRVPRAGAFVAAADRTRGSWR